MERSGYGAHEREIELKYGLMDRNAFERLLSTARSFAPAGSAVDEARLQENYFYDTPSRALGAQRLSLRLRCEGEDRRLTLKGPTQGTRTEGPSIREEVERSIPFELADSVLRGEAAPEALLDWLEAQAAPASGLVRAVRGAASDAPLVPLGHFRNLRTRVPLALELAGVARTLTLEFDESHFPGGRCEFEVELELESEAHVEAASSAMAGLFEAAAVETFSTRGKLARMLTALDGRSAAGPASAR